MNNANRLSDGVYAQTDIYASITDVAETLIPELLAVFDEFGYSPALIRVAARVTSEMREYGFDLTDDDAQRTATRVIRKRLTSDREWAARNIGRLTDQAEAEHIADSDTVYYVDLYGAAIKIGYTSNLPSRLRGLRRRPEHVLATEHGGRALEALRHAQFARERQDSGFEDFDRSPRLMAHIDSLRTAA